MCFFPSSCDAKGKKKTLLGIGHCGEMKMKRKRKEKEKEMAKNTEWKEREKIEKEERRSNACFSPCLPVCMKGEERRRRRGKVWVDFRNKFREIK